MMTCRSPRPTTRALAGSAILLLGLWGCTGNIDAMETGPTGTGAGKGTGDGRGPGESPRPGRTEPGAQPGATQGPEAPSAASTTTRDGFVIECAGNKTCEGEESPLRRLTNREYLNTVRDLLGITSDPTGAFEAESVVDGFENNATTQLATEPIARQYFLAARALADEVSSRIQELAPCDAGRGETACAGTFVAEFGKRAFRRPLLDGEKALYEGLYARVRETGASHTEGLSSVLQALLASPPFFYRFELTGRLQGPQNPGELAKLSGWEIASRLSYFLWQTMPDTELMTAAEQGRLSSKEEIVAQARRLLQAPRGKEVVHRFLGQWLELEGLGEIEKDEKVFPQFTDKVRKELAAEAEAFVDHVFWEKKGRLQDLLTAPVTFRNGALATFYGDGLGAGDRLVMVDLSRSKRRGLLGTGAMAAKLASISDSDPVERGQFVRERLLCGFIPDPPDGVLEVAPPVNPEHTKRERFAVHTNIKGCDSCHKLIDPIGLALENYDGIGRWRDTEKGKPIDTSGTWAPEDGGKSFRDGTEMLAQLAASPRVYDCAVKTWFRFAMGRSEIKSDLPALAGLYDRFRDSGADMHALVMDLVQSTAFTSRVVAK